MQNDNDSYFNHNCRPKKQCRFIKKLSFYMTLGIFSLSFNIIFLRRLQKRQFKIHWKPIFNHH